MIWVVLGFDRNDESLVAKWELPSSFTEESAAELVGAHPDLIGSSFPLSDGQLAVIDGILGLGADSAEADYFLEAVDDSRQG